MFIEMKPCLSLETLNQVDLSRPGRCKVWVWVLLEASSSLPMDPCLDACNPEQMGSSSKLGLGRTFFKETLQGALERGSWSS